MNDAQFLRSVAETIKARMEGEEGDKLEPYDVARLRRIADEIEPDTQPFRPIDPEDK
jgi:hypothetical protein